MRISRLLTLGIFVVASTGCMSEVKSPGRAKTLSYDCSGIGSGWGDCTEKADAQCGARNYTIVSQDGAAEGKGSGGNTQMKRTLVVSCK